LRAPCDSHRHASLDEIFYGHPARVTSCAKNEDHCGAKVINRAPK
jgi:hypothetical protein